MNNFYELYASIKSIKERTQLRDEILKRCSIAYSTFYIQLKKKNFAPLAQKEISTILDRPLCCLFPIEENKYSINN